MFCRKDDQESYAATIALAWEDLEQRSENAAAGATGAEYRPKDRSLALPLLDRTVRVFVSERYLSLDDGSKPSLAEKVMILHHLAFSNGARLAGTKVAFREIPGCQFYNQTYTAHTTVALAKAFDNDPAAFEMACARLGGKREQGSGVVMRFEAFPRVPLWMVFWPGDDEMPSGAQILFDSSVSGHLPAEDIAVLGEYAVHRAIEASGRDSGGCLYGLP